MSKFLSAVIKAHGSNCEIETNNILNSCGFHSEIIHINDLISKKKNILTYSFIVLPGGFSYGDYTGSGRIAASVISHHLINDFKTFIANGKCILGICNGFQILVKSGILPNINGDYNQNVSLIFNDSHQYEDRWVRVKVRDNSIFTRDIDEIMELPIAHAEGKFVFDSDDMEPYIVMQYVNSKGAIDDTFPINPNGSKENIAAITDSTGRILGMMPHPERFYTNELHYSGSNNGITGRVIFDNAYKYIKEEL